MGAVHVLAFGSPPSPALADGANLRVNVVYTTPESTQASLKLASLLAQDLGADLELLVPHVVPYPLPLNRPDTPAAFTEDFLARLVRPIDVDVRVKVLLCRDREETIPQWLPSQAITVIGRKRRWGPDSFWRLIRAIRRKGHHVIVVDARTAACRSAVAQASHW